MKKLFLSATLLTGFAAQAQLVPVDQSSTRNQAPQMFTPFNGHLYFMAQDAANGTELWRYAGTGAPTVAYDLRVGGQSGGLSQNYKSMAVVGSTLYYIGDDGSTGWELYKYTGSGAATLTTEINVGSSLPSEVKNLAVLGNRVFFSARVSATGYELYSYDPTTNAATLYDFRPGTNSTEPDLLTPMGGKLYFLGTDNAMGTELMVFDPNSNTVSLASDVNTGPSASDPHNLTVVGNNLYFSAYTPTNGRELYRFDGTTATRLTDVSPGTGNGVGDYGNNQERPRQIASYNGNIYFAGDFGTNGSKLYKYDVANNTTTLVHTINAGNSNTPPLSLTEYAGKLYFAADDGMHGLELWVHDGTNTSMVTDLIPGTSGSSIGDMIVWNGALYLNAAGSGIGNTLFKFTETSGIENIRLDGTVNIFPNPAVDAWNIRLTLNHPTALSLAICDAMGREVSHTGLKEYLAGNSEIKQSAASLPAGTYFYRLSDAHGQPIAAGKLERR